jgi:hypothetical protein
MTLRPRASALLGAAILVPGAALAQPPETRVDAVAYEAATRQADSQAPRLSVSLGANHWSGDFGAPTKTKISSVLVSARYRHNGLRLNASIPWMRIKSQGAVFSGIDGAPLIVAEDPVMAARPRRDSIGDLTLGAAYLVPGSGAGGVDVDLIGKVKVPTRGKLEGVSTGKADYALGVEVSKPMGAFTPMASVRYRGFGNAGEWALRDGWAASVGGGYALSRDVVVLASYDYAEAASGYIGDSHELVGGVSASLGRNLRATGFLSTGLSDGAADIGGGLSLTTGF